MSRTLVPILTLLGLSLGSAREGAISGTVFAVPDGDVAGTIVIACYAPAGECDDGSPHTHHTVIAQSGTSAPFTLTELAPEQYLLVAMRDLNASDTLDDGDHLAVYGGSLEAPVLVSPPAANLNLQLEVMGATSPQAEAPSATPSPPPELVREWAQGSVSATSFYNPLTGAWAAPSGTGASYHFHLDGSYSYAGLIQTGLYGCTTSVFIYEEGGAYVEDRVMMLVPASGTIRSQDNCNASFNYERPTELETNYYLWEINRDEYASLRLQLLELALGASGLLDVKEEAEWLSYYAR